MVDNSISNSSIPVLPSQQGLSLSEVVFDCLSKIQALTRVNPEDIREISGGLCFYQYFTTLSDLTEIAIDALDKVRATRE